MKQHLSLQQKQEIVAKRLSGNYTLEEIGKQYGVTRERVRQIVRVANLQKSLPRQCIKCERTFYVHTGNRLSCRKKGCVRVYKERPCIDCNTSFTPKHYKQLLRCSYCWPKYRRQQQYEVYIPRYVAKLKALGVSRLNN